jgi:hypothetical protein
MYFYIYHDACSMWEYAGLGDLLPALEEYVRCPCILVAI